MAEPLLHLISLDDWARRRSWEPLRAASLASEGFAHCTVGDELMLRVANQFYTVVPGSFVVLSIDRTRLTSPLRWERPAGADALAHVAFPHIYGPIDLRSIVSLRAILRDHSGSFVGFGPPKALARGMWTELASADLESAVEVYGRLGFVRLDGSDGVMSRDGVKLRLVHEGAEGPVGTGSVFLMVTDADAMFDEWAALDVPGKLIEPVDIPTGGREGSYVDVDGNVIRFRGPAH